MCNVVFGVTIDLDTGVPHVPYSCCAGPLIYDSNKSESHQAEMEGGMHGCVVCAHHCFWEVMPDGAKGEACRRGLAKGHWHDSQGEACRICVLRGHKEYTGKAKHPPHEANKPTSGPHAGKWLGWAGKPCIATCCAKLRELATAHGGLAAAVRDSQDTDRAEAQAAERAADKDDIARGYVDEMLAAKEGTGEWRTTAPDGEPAGWYDGELLAADLTWAVYSASEDGEVSRSKALLRAFREARNVERARRMDAAVEAGLLEPEANRPGDEPSRRAFVIACNAIAKDRAAAAKAAKTAAAAAERKAKADQKAAVERAAATAAAVAAVQAELAALKAAVSPNPSAPSADSASTGAGGGVGDRTVPLLDGAGAGAVGNDDGDLLAAMMDVDAEPEPEPESESEPESEPEPAPAPAAGKGKGKGKGRGRGRRGRAADEPAPKRPRPRSAAPAPAPADDDASSSDEGGAVAPSRRQQNSQRWADKDGELALSQQHRSPAQRESHANKRANASSDCRKAKQNAAGDISDALTRWSGFTGRDVPKGFYFKKQGMVPATILRTLPGWLEAERAQLEAQRAREQLLLKLLYKQLHTSKVTNWTNPPLASDEFADDAQFVAWLRDKGVTALPTPPDESDGDDGEDGEEGEGEGEDTADALAGMM